MTAANPSALVATSATPMITGRVIRFLGDTAAEDVNSNMNITRVRVPNEVTELR